MKVSKSTATRIMTKIKNQFKKTKGQYVTPKEFCEVTGFDLDLVLLLLSKLNK